MVTVKHQGADDTTGVTFGGTAGTAFTKVDDETVQVTTPAHAAGAVDVVVQDADGFDVPGERLVCEDTDGGDQSRFRFASDADERSWYERKHQRFALIEPEDGGAGVQVTEHELALVQKLLTQIREGSG